MRTCIQAMILAFGLQLSDAAGAAPTRVALQVICDDQGAKELISMALRTRLEAAGLQITDRFPVRKLFVYAQRDVDDTINTNGWSFAVVHTSNQATFFVASKLLPSDPPLPTEVRTALVGMLNEEGFLAYANVAHADRLDQASVSTIAASIVGEFRRRVPSEQASGQ